MKSIVKTIKYSTYADKQDHKILNMYRKKTLYFFKTEMNK